MRNMETPVHGPRDKADDSQPTQAVPQLLPINSAGAAGAAADVASASGTLHRPNCRNCGTELLGHYCIECGQAADVHVPTTRELLHEALEGLTHSDSRLWRSLMLLWFRPGELTGAFIAGKRMSYLPPFRLYLILSVIFFLTAALTHEKFQVVTLGGSNGVSAQRPGVVTFTNGANCSLIDLSGHPAWTERVQRACGRIAGDNGASLMHAAIATMPKAMFIFLPLIAFLHMLMYWRPRHRYAEDLLFFLHLHAFFFSVMTVYELVGLGTEHWPALAGPGTVIAALLLWWLPIYTFLAMRRVFQRSWPNTLLKLAALSVTYVMMLMLTVSAVFIYAALEA